MQTFVLVFTYLATLCWAFGCGVFAQCPVDSVPLKIPSVYGKINAMVASDSLIYIGGDFSYIGPESGGAVLVDKLTGERRRFPIFHGRVSTAVSDRAGGWYVGGDFTKVDTFQRNGLAHVLPDGTLDLKSKPTATIGAPNGPHIQGNVLRLITHQDVLYISGYFTSIDGKIRNTIAAFDLKTTKLLAWAPRVQLIGGKESINAMLPYKDTLFIGGYFHYVNGVTRNGLAAVNAKTGETLEWNPRLSTNFSNNPSSIYDLTIHENVIYALGFIKIAGVDVQYRIASFNLKDATPIPVNLLIEGVPHLYKIKSVAGKLCLSGVNMEYQNNKVYALFFDPKSGVVDTALQNMIRRPYGYMSQVLEQNDTLYVYGYTLNPSDILTVITRFDLKTKTRLPLKINGRFSVLGILTLGVDSQSILMGGESSFFTFAPSASFIAAFLPETSAFTTFNPEIASDSSASEWPIITDLALQDSILYVIGEFSMVNDVSRNGFAAFNVSTGQLTDFQPSITHTLRLNDSYSGKQSGPLSIWGDYLGVAGDIKLPNGDKAVGVVLNRHSGEILYAIKDSLRSSIGTAVLLTDSTYYFGINSDIVKNNEYYARIESGRLSDGLPYPWKPEFIHHNNQYINGINAIKKYENRIYVGGGFYKVGDSFRRNVACFDLKTGLLVENWAPRVHNSVVDIAFHQNKIILIGIFGAIDELETMFIGFLDAPNGSNLTLDCPHLMANWQGSYFTGMSIVNDQLWLSGNFALYRTGPYWRPLGAYRFREVPECPAPCGKNEIKIYPNPSDDGVFTLATVVPNGGEASLNVYDISGRVIATQNVRLSPGLNEVKIDLSDKVRDFIG